MILSDYEIGARLCLDVFDDFGIRIEREFISQFEEAYDEYEALIAVPIVEGVVYAIRNGWRLTVYMQKNNTLYRFFAKVVERSIKEGIHYMRVLRVSDIDEAQRRKFYRFSCELPVRYRVIEDIYTDLDKEYRHGVTADLSGAGMCLRLHEVVEVNNIVECEIDFGDVDLALIGHIVRRSKRLAVITNRMLYEYDVGILFSDIADRDRDFIVKFIFEEQRRQLKNTTGF